MAHLLLICLQTVQVVCVCGRAQSQEQNRPDYWSLHNRPLWLYLWNSITLTQIDGLAVSGDVRHLLASAGMSSPRHGRDWGCVTGNKRRDGSKQEDRWREEKRRGEVTQVYKNVEVLKSSMMFRFKHTNSFTVRKVLFLSSITIAKELWRATLKTNTVSSSLLRGTTFAESHFCGFSK